MAAPSNEKMLKNFRALFPAYVEFAKDIEHLLRNLVASADVTPQSITSRVKEVESLEEKLGREGKHYTSLNEVTDLVGLRIITYFPDEVDTLAEVIRAEFAIDDERSIDKRKADDSFGYSSLHLIAGLGENRCALREYTGYRGMLCEIQIRSVLQHAWAEIQHDLGYKRPEESHPEHRRRFARIAALLEVADHEFIQLRNDIREYQTSLDEARILGLEIDINEFSLIWAIEAVPEIKQIEVELAARFDFPPLPDPHQEAVARRVSALQDSGFKTLKDLVAAYSRLGPKLGTFMETFLRDISDYSPSWGFSIFFLCELRAGEEEKLETTVGWLRDLWRPSEQRHEWAVGRAERVRRIVRGEEL